MMHEENFQSIIKYKFKDINLLKTALTHSSFKKESNEKIEDNERLEFLGDAFLDAIIGSLLFELKDNFPEGKLTKFRSLIVCERALADIARKINLGDYMYLGHGEDIHGGREKDSILSDCMEAVIGALYEDGGYDASYHFVKYFFKDKINDALSGLLFSDYKSQLQELLQKDGKDIELKYVLDVQDGPAHDRVFKIHLECNNKVLGEGTGKSKKEAEQIAAKNSLEILKEENINVF